MKKPPKIEKEENKATPDFGVVVKPIFSNSRIAGLRKENKEDTLAQCFIDLLEQAQFENSRITLNILRAISFHQRLKGSSAYEDWGTEVVPPLLQG